MTQSNNGAEEDLRFITAPRLYWTFVISMFGIGCVHSATCLKTWFWDTESAKSVRQVVTETIDTMQGRLAEGVKHIEQQKLAKNDRDNPLTDEEIEKRIGKNIK